MVGLTTPKHAKAWAPASPSKEKFPTITSCTSASSGASMLSFDHPDSVTSVAGNLCPPPRLKLQNTVGHKNYLDWSGASIHAERARAAPSPLTICPSMSSNDEMASPACKIGDDADKARPPASNKNGGESKQRDRPPAGNKNIGERKQHDRPQEQRRSASSIALNVQRQRQGPSRFIKKVTRAFRKNAAMAVPASLDSAVTDLPPGPLEEEANPRAETVGASCLADAKHGSTPSVPPPAAIYANGSGGGSGGGGSPSAPSSTMSDFAPHVEVLGQEEVSEDENANATKGMLEKVHLSQREISLREGVLNSMTANLLLFGGTMECANNNLATLAEEESNVVDDGTAPNFCMYDEKRNEVHVKEGAEYGDVSRASGASRTLSSNGSTGGMSERIKVVRRRYQSAAMVKHLNSLCYHRSKADQAARQLGEIIKNQDAGGIREVQGAVSASAGKKHSGRSSIGTTEHRIINKQRNKMQMEPKKRTRGSRVVVQYTERDSNQ